MGSTYSSVQYHVVFGCKERTRSLTPEIRKQVFPYIAGTAKSLGCVLLDGNGVADHVHLLVGAPPRLSISDVVGKLKANASRWINETWRNDKFDWQDGYSVFSVGFREIPVVRAYIDGQEEHHRKESFHEEITRMLNEYGVQFDPRYLKPNG